MNEIFALMDAADGALDRETYEQFRRDDFDTPDDCEIWVTASTVRKINRLFSALDKLRWRIA